MAGQRKREADRLKAVKRAEGNWYFVGSLLSAAAVWPLGRWMNRTESRHLVDPETGQHVELQTGGGHTLFFIPMQYRAPIWAFFEALPRVWWVMCVQSAVLPFPGRPP